MKIIIPYFLLTSLFASCFSSISNTGEIELEVLNYEIIENNYIRINYNKNNTYIEIHEKVGASILKYGASNVRLNYEINFINLIDCYKSKIKQIGDVLILEYSLNGASGIASHIIVTTVIELTDNVIIHSFTYNSFVNGIKALSIENGSLSLDIFDYHRSDVSEKEYYCLTKFVYKNDFETMDEAVKCFVYDDDTDNLVKELNCTCQKLTIPEVIIAYE